MKQKIIGFELLNKGIARHGYEVELNDEIIGEVTTGYHSITLKKAIGLALINKPELKLGDKIKIKIHSISIDEHQTSYRFRPFFSELKERIGLERTEREQAELDRLNLTKVEAE